MKQGTLFFRIIILLLLAVVVAYFGSSAASSLQDTLLTATAVEYEAGDTYLASGYFVRNEEVLTSTNPITIPTVSEGTKVGVGQALAHCYTDSAAQQRHVEIQQLEAQMRQLVYASTAVTDSVALDNNILDNLTALAVYVNRRDISAASALNTDLKSLVLRRYSDTSELSAISSEIAALSSQITELNSQTSSSVRTISAARSGYFSGTVDGYESILKPETLTSMTVAEFQALDHTAGALDDAAFGKMIYGDLWYFVTLIPEEYEQTLSKRSTVSVEFTQGIPDPISMKIVRIGEPVDGKCVLVLSYRNFLSEITTLRQQSANIVFSSYHGLRVPKAAVRMENDVSGVYILEGTTAKWKPITILCEYGEHYVVEMDKSDTGNLWPGDEIIVNGKNLFDGKVVS